MREGDFTEGGVAEGPEEDIEADVADAALE